MIRIKRLAGVALLPVIGWLAAEEWMSARPAQAASSLTSHEGAVASCQKALRQQAAAAPRTSRSGGDTDLTSLCSDWLDVSEPERSTVLSSQSYPNLKLFQNGMTR